MADSHDQPRFRVEAAYQGKLEPLATRCRAAAAQAVSRDSEEQFATKTGSDVANP
jgi:hypothetical protein